MIATAVMDFPWEEPLKVGHNERGWLTSFPFGPGLTRFTMVHADGRALPQDEPVTVEELSRCVSEILDEQVEIPPDSSQPAVTATHNGSRTGCVAGSCSSASPRGSTTRPAASA